MAGFVIGEYLNCTIVDPTRWHERSGWVRNPRPFNVFEASLRRYQQTGEMTDYAWDKAIRGQWFATVKDELLQRMLTAAGRAG